MSSAATLINPFDQLYMLEDMENKAHDADPPFDNSTADFVLRSADRVNFRVHKIVLSLASSVFESMFTLPDSKHPEQELLGGIPVIDLVESSAVIDSFLRLCYPTPDPIFLSLSSLLPVYDAIDKYALDSVALPVTKALIQCAPQDPMTAYAFGCAHRLHDLVKVAARELLVHSIDRLPNSSRLDRINASHLYRLLEYHSACRTAASALALQDWSWIRSISRVPLCTTAPMCSTCRTCLQIQNRLNAIPGAHHSLVNNKDCWTICCPTWWFDYMKRAEAALEHKPRGETVLSEGVLGPALASAVQCEVVACRSGMRAMMDFSKYFAQAVENALDKVCRIFVLIAVYRIA